MGDPLSPAICMAVLAHQENKWMSKQPEETISRIKACRFMDDIYMVMDASGDFDHDSVFQDFDSS